MTQTTDRQEELVRLFIDAAIEVHRELGPGYDEAIYENALAVELEFRKIPLFITHIHLCVFASLR